MTTKKTTIKPRSRIRRAALALGAGTAALTLWGTLIERNLFTLRRESLPLLAAGSAPVRVLHLSDLHLAPWQRRKSEWVRSLRSLNPDLVVLTGDLMGHAHARGALQHTLRPFADAEVPTVFVHGSNDYYSPILKNPLKYLQEPSRQSTLTSDLDTAALTRMLEDDLGFHDLNNAAADLDVAGQRIRFFGLGDPHIRYDDAEHMAQSLAPLDEAGPAALRLGVVHAPYRESLDDLLQQQADLIFAGHTHGGQVRVPLIGALTSNSDLPPAQARGLSVWFDERHAAFLHVSAGLGTSITAPVRVLCRPEATLITLTAGD